MTQDQGKLLSNSKASDMTICSYTVLMLHVTKYNAQPTCPKFSLEGLQVSQVEGVSENYDGGNVHG